jgi:hypothetical protein
MGEKSRDMDSALIQQFSFLIRETRVVGVIFLSIMFLSTIVFIFLYNA